MASSALREIVWFKICLMYKILKHIKITLTSKWSYFVDTSVPLTLVTVQHDVLLGLRSTTGMRTMSRLEKIRHTKTRTSTSRGGLVLSVLLPFKFWHPPIVLIMDPLSRLSKLKPGSIPRVIDQSTSRKIEINSKQTFQQ